MTIARQAAMLGGNVRVGLEDSLWIVKGALAGLEVATPADARKMLGWTSG